MTPALLREALALHAPDTVWPDTPEALLAAVERHADRHPGAPQWTQLVLAAHDLAVEPPALEGMHARELVRVDPWSTTWTAADTEGELFLVRVVRPGSGAVHRRVLERDRRGLAGLVPGVVEIDGGLAAPAPGTPLQDAGMTERDVVRVLGDTLVLIDRWRAAGLAPSPPDPEEIRVVDGRLRVVSLTPAAGGNALLDTVVAALPTPGEGPIARFLEGLKALEPEAGEAVALFRRALADSLGQRAVELRRRHLASTAGTQRARLYSAIEHLAAALPPPRGTGPIGYDLDGHPTRVESDGTRVTWGSDDPAPLFADGAFDAPQARRFLRACATAPTRPETGGDPAVTDAMGRWVAAGLKLRTLRLLLEKA